MKKLNWNSFVKVKLTDLGRDIYYHRFDGLIERGINITPQYPKEDENGYCGFQLWSFMQLYGGYIGMALPKVAEDISFYIDEEDLEDVKED